MADAADFRETEASPARRRVRRTATLLATVLVLVGLVPRPLSETAHADTATRLSADADAGTVSVAIDSLTPAAPREDDTVTLSGSVTNTGEAAVTDARVDLRLGGRLDTTSGIDQVARNDDTLGDPTGDPVDDEYAVGFRELSPGVTEKFQLSVPVAELGLGKDGVYQLAVSVSGQTTARSWEHVVGVRRTFLPWQPEESATLTRTTFLWPLISTAHMAAETGSDEYQTPVFLDDDLAKDLSPGGRLHQMVALGSGLDVTWVIDPDLLASVAAMAGGYEVRDQDGETVPGTHQDVAKRWLVDLQKAVSGDEVVALPYADPDVASLAHNGKDATGSLGQFEAATEVAANTVEPILHVTPTTDFAWPMEGALDSSIVRVATSAGADKVIARSDSLREDSDLPYTPSAARPVGGGTTAVVADARQSTAFEGDLSRASAATLAVQRFLAQSLAVTLQTNQQRSVVVAPQRMPSGSQAHAMAEALNVLQGGTWSRPQGLTEAAAAKPDPAASTRIPAASSYPAELREGELPEAAFAQIAATQAKLDDFKVILSAPYRVVTPFGLAMNREMSTSWRGGEGQAATFRDEVVDYLDGLAQQVRLIDKSETKLSGRSATIPVTVQNNLVQGVDHLVLRLTSTNPTRLEIGGEAFQEQPVSVSGGHSKSVKFDTSANANGRATVIAQLYTPDGEEYGPPVTFDVKVTEITATVMLVIGGGVLLLVLAGFRMYTQRKRATSQDTPEAAPDTTPGTAQDPSVPGNREAAVDSPAGLTGESRPDDPEHPSDRPPDTTPESTGPSGTGERVER
ncbi:DUF6049 family protein [Streptomyces sp. HSG2]|uniref:DUF6049 family protein n=1 Tax=Streptomyces sp. HSG2 TaxID=2797167 RepID=UPI001905511A|nr:DUF6049 family protein [Streptomyces sp. HSG2]